MMTRLKKAPLALASWLGVSPRPRGARILVAHGTPARTAAALERQLRYLRRRFRIVPLAELVQAVERADGDVDGMVALTFDDGLRSNVCIAYPILRRLGIPATFFVCPGLIDERRCLWTHEARLRLRALGLDPDPLTEWMKTLETPARLAVEEALRRETPGLRPSAAEQEAVELAGWDELRALDPGVVTIGSHGASHAILSRASDAELDVEIGGSRRVLEERLDRAIEFFCYPNGSVGEAAAAHARRHYRAAVAVGGLPVPPRADLHVLPRLNLPRGTLRLASRMAHA